ncbi:MAG: nucleotidyltransferase domain-containing protein [Chloroflexota bacterium]
MPEEKIEQFLHDITTWASARSDLLALAVVGSYARGAATATSDLDLVLITTHPDQYLHNQAWVQQFGAVEKQQVEEYGLLTSLRAWYSDGLEVEFGITDESWAALPLDEGSHRVIANGMRILFEKDCLLSRHQ